MKYIFGDCELDIANHALRCAGAPVRVEPQVFDMLAVLAEAAGELVSYDSLIEKVWNGRIVSDATVAARISAARAAVGDSGKKQGVIRTVPRRGVQMAVQVVPRSCASADVAPAEPGISQQVRMTASADGSGIAWSSLGDGLPLLRAGHWMTHLELDLDSIIWRPWIERLGRGRRLVRYDPRGTGLSGGDCGPRSLGTNVEDMAAVADAAGLERFDMFCTSQGAAVACMYAAQNPGRVRRMIIYGGFAQGSLKRGDAGKAMTAALATMILQGWGQPEGGFMRSFSSLFIPTASRAQMLDFVQMQVASAKPEVAVDIRACCANYDVVSLLGRIQAPTLVIHAARDNLHPYSQAQLFARLIPDARIRQLDSDNHVLLPDEPAFQELMQAVDSFLSEAG